MTRRSFVKTAALTGVAATLGVSIAGKLEETDAAYAASSSPRTMYKTVCHGCIQCCPCRAYVEDGVVVKLEGDPDAPVSKGSMCLKGMSQLHTVYSPRHVLYPMKRVGLRGGNEWEVISWDEAIDLAGKQYAEIIQKYGPYAFICVAGGGGNYTSDAASTWPYALGAANQVSPGALQCYLPRYSAAYFALGNRASQSMADSAVLEPFNEDSPMQVIVEWGAQPSTSQTAQSGRGMADSRANRGVKTVVIDPYMTPDAAKADVWLPVRPGSDTALVLCWIRYIIENNLYDEQFCKYWTNLPFLINPNTKLPIEAKEVWPDYVNPAEDPNDVYDTPAFVCYDAKTDSVQPFPFTAPKDSPVDPVLLKTASIPELGIEAKTAFQIYWEEAELWTLEKTAEVCWLKENKIEEAVRLYAEAEYAGIAHGVFSDMMNISSQMPFGALALDIMMGHVGTPGSTITYKGKSSRGTVRATGYYNTEQLTKYGLCWKVGLTKKENDRLIAKTIAGWDEKGQDGKAKQEYFAQVVRDGLGSNEHKGRNVTMQSKISLVRQAIATGEPYPLKGMYEVSGNKLSAVADPMAWVEARDNLDFVAQQYPNMTSFTLEFVDLFLPLEEWLEWEHGSSFVSQANVNFLRRRIIHLGETAHNNIVPAKVNEKICEYMGGKDKVFDSELLENKMYASTEAAEAAWAKTWGADSWDDVKKNPENFSPKVTPPEDYWQYYQHEDIAEDGLPVGFATMSRKTEPYIQIVLRMARTGFPFMYPFEQEPCPDYSPICTYVEPQESPLTDTEYPLVMTSGRVHYWHHSTMRHAPYVRELHPAPDVRINPKTATESGIKHMDWVKVTSRRGDCHGRAYLTEGIAPGVVWMELFWNPECFDSSQKTITAGWRECNVSCTTLEGAGNEVFGSATYRAYQVKVEKSTKPERIWVAPEEFEPFMPTLHDEPQTEEVF
jgi:anaerobic selenocysteine-containing dehydrogenase